MSQTPYFERSAELGRNQGQAAPNAWRGDNGAARKGEML
jgi:hypothetical protein